MNPRHQLYLPDKAPDPIEAAMPLQALVAGGAYTFWNIE